MKNNNYFSTNLQAILEIFPKMANQIIDYCRSVISETSEIVIDNSLNGENIIAISKNNRLIYFNSRYNSDKSSKIWAEQYKNKSYQEVFIVFGLGNGGAIRELINVTSETNLILVYEPNPQIFLKVMNNMELSDIFRSGRVFISVENINNDMLLEFTSEIISYSKIKYIELCKLPLYEELYGTKLDYLLSIIKQTLEILFLDRNTQIEFSNEFIRNMLVNFRDMPNQYAINQIKEALCKYDLSNTPAIVVSAGPSLDKNIKELKSAEGKAFIIVSDTAIKSVLREGIMPDFIVTVDAHKNPYLFAHKDVTNIPMLVCQHSNKEIWGIHKGKRFYFGDDNSYILDLYSRFAGIGLEALETGGSVSNNCFSFAQYCGFKKIILIGQDLAFSGKKMHADCAYDSCAYDNIEDSVKYPQVEDIYGNKVYTDKSMELYLRWFEKQIVRYPELKVIDATEGGARIKGTELMSLKEAILRECRAEINFKQIISDINPLFDIVSRDKFVGELNAISINMFKIKDEIDQGIKSYQKLEKYTYTNMINSNQFNKCIKDIEKINYEIEHTPVMELAAIYNRKMEYEIQDNLFFEEDDEVNEIRHLVKNGVKLLLSYKIAIDELLEDIENIGITNMRELYELLASVRVYMSRIVRSCHIDDYNIVNRSLNSMIKSLVKGIDRINCGSTNNLLEIDMSCFNEMLYDILFAQEEKNYGYLSDILEQRYISFICGILNNMQTNGLIPWEEYEKENMEVLKTSDTELYNKVIDNVIDDNRYTPVFTYSGEISIRINENNYYTTSIDPFMSGEEKFYNCFDENVSEYIIFGFNLPWLKAIHNLNKKTKVTVYEPDINIIHMTLKYNNICTLLKNPNYNIIHDPDLINFSKKIKNYHGNMWMHKPCVDNINSVKIKKSIMETFIAVNSAQTQRKLLYKNFVDNLLDVPDLIDDIIDKFKNKKMIYIAGGPSLDEDISKLSHKNKDYMLLSAGTSAKKLINSNIIPDYIIVTDPKDSILSQIEGLDSKQCENITLLYISTLSNKVSRYWTNKKYMILQKDFDMAERYAKKKNAITFMTGGSVSTLAVDIALRCGCSRLICVGLDLAYIYNKMHACEIKNTENTISDKDNNFVMVKSVNGDMVKTTHVYEIYRKFIEDRIKMDDVKSKSGSVRIINSSKGAYIEGMEHMSLEEAITIE